MDRSKARVAAEKIRAETHKDAQWVGTVGKREVFTLTVVAEPQLVGDPDARWGRLTLYKFVDGSGNEVAYFASRSIRVPSGDFREEFVCKSDDPEAWTHHCSSNTTVHGEGVGPESHPAWRVKRPDEAPAGHVHLYEKVPLDRAIQVGDTIKIKATVKKHEEFRGVKQTLVTRGALTEFVGAIPVFA